MSVNQYELAVRNAIFEIGQGGMFRVGIDETNVSADGEFHMVGHGEIFRTILGELDDARRVIGRQAGNFPGNDSDAFYRGVDGNLWHRAISAGIEEDTGIPILGAPDAAFVAGDPAPVFNVVARNLQSAPVIASTFHTTGEWSYRTLPGRLDNDPTIVPGQGNSELWIFGLGTNYWPYVWDSSGNFVQISTTPVLGPLSASLRQFEQGFHVFYMAWDRSVAHSYRTDPQSPWQTESLGGLTSGSPLALSCRPRAIWWSSSSGPTGCCTGTARRTAIRRRRTNGAAGSRSHRLRAPRGPCSPGRRRSP